MDSETLKVLRAIREAEGWYELELYDDALEVLALLPLEGPHRRVVLTLKGEILRSAERFEEGAETFEILISAEPDTVAGHVGLGWCRKRLGRLDLALQAMESLLDKRPNEAIGIYNLACYCALAGDRDRALHLLGRVAVRDEDYGKMALEEADFESIREDPEFRRLTGGEEK